MLSLRGITKSEQRPSGVISNRSNNSSLIRMRTFKAEDFRDRVCTEIATRGLSFAKTARLAKIQPTTLYRIRSGKMVMRIDVLLKVAYALGIDLREYIR